MSEERRPKGACAHLAFFLAWRPHGDGRRRAGVVRWEARQRVRAEASCSCESGSLATKVRRQRLNGMAGGDDGRRIEAKHVSSRRRRPSCRPRRLSRAGVVGQQADERAPARLQRDVRRLLWDSWLRRRCQPGAPVGGGDWHPDTGGWTVNEIPSTPGLSPRRRIPHVRLRLYCAEYSRKRGDAFLLPRALLRSPFPSGLSNSGDRRSSDL